MDAFKVYFTDNIAALLIGYTGVVKVPAGCTSKLQSSDVCINKHFTPILGECWEDLIVKVVKDAANEANNNTSIKLSSPTRQEIVN